MSHTTANLTQQQLHLKLPWSRCPHELKTIQNYSNLPVSMNGSITCCVLCIFLVRLWSWALRWVVSCWSFSWSAKHFEIKPLSRSTSACSKLHLHADDTAEVFSLLQGSAESKRCCNAEFTDKLYVYIEIHIYMPCMKSLKLMLAKTMAGSWD